MSKLLYSWKFDSKKQRGQLWYIIVLSIAIGIIVWGFLSKQYGMSFVIIILIGLAFYVENNSGDIINVEIKETGINIDGNFYSFASISKYTIIYENENAILLRLFVVNKIGVKNLDVGIDNNIEIEIRNILSNVLEESGKEQLKFTEKIIRLLKL